MVPQDFDNSPRGLAIPERWYIPTPLGPIQEAEGFSHDPIWIRANDYIGPNLDSHWTLRILAQS
jgi:hypothetical protein